MQIIYKYSVTTSQRINSISIIQLIQLMLFIRIKIHYFRNRTAAISITWWHYAELSNVKTHLHVVITELLNCYFNLGSCKRKFKICGGDSWSAGQVQRKGTKCLPVSLPPDLNSGSNCAIWNLEEKGKNILPRTITLYKRNVLKLSSYLTHLLNISSTNSVTILRDVKHVVTWLNST